MLPRPRVSEEDAPGPENRGLVFPEGPKCPTRLPTGWHRRCWTLFRVKRGRLLTNFRQRVRRTRGEKTRVRTRILLPKPGAHANGNYRPNEPKTGVPRRGNFKPTNVQRGYRRVGTFGFCHSRAQLERILAVFRQKAKKDPRRETTGAVRVLLQRPSVPGRGHCLVFPDGDIAGPNSDTDFDPSLEYSTDKVVFFWQPPSYFPPLSPSSFAVDDMPYSCADQYMMA